MAAPAPIAPPTTLPIPGTTEPSAAPVAAPAPITAKLGTCAATAPGIWEKNSPAAESTPPSGLL